MLSQEILRLAEMYAGQLQPLQAEIAEAEAGGLVVFVRRDLATVLRTWAAQVEELEVYKHVLAKVTDALLTDDAMVALAARLSDPPSSPPNEGGAA